jgi:CheY-like chemotaxis protein
MRKKVLIVEDDAEFREMLSKLLELEGFKVVSVGNCIKAFSLFYTQHPSVVVTDLGLPDLSGFELIRWAREKQEFADLPIVAISAYGRTYLRAALANGATEALDKTDDLDHLIEVLDKVA